MNNRIKNEVSLEILAARFAYAGAAVTTLGEILSTISAGLALRILEEAAATNTNRNSSSNPSNDSMFYFEVEQMQRQMDELIREMKRLKKMMSS